MPYEPTYWKTGDLISSSRLNHIEQGIAGLYPQEIIVAPEQTITITSEDTPPGVIIALADGYTLPEELPNNWSVVVNGKTLEYQPFGNYTLDLDPLLYGVDLIDGALYFYCDGESHQLVPGDYIVKITEATQESGGILIVKQTNDGVNDKLDKTAAEIWDAMKKKNKLVLIYASDGTEILNVNFIYNAAHYNDDHGYFFQAYPNMYHYTADSDTDYPVYQASPK